ncbi:MAG: NifU family protein [Spirochaetaceae bacterium]|jgi:Fe-S cluster biogenesis protein NfuA|nr:NifU family protein [Spirochaetaceae bacterium]MBQ1983786.1 NifU family protein [Spirochaetaceae bacterium]
MEVFKMEDKIKRAIEHIRPQLQADGGDIEFVKFDEEGKVHVRLTGACGSCPMATMTLKSGVEVFLKENIPEVTEVVQVF